jgi:hypothetical protein
VQLLLWIFQHAAYETKTADLSCSHQWCPNQSRKKKNIYIYINRKGRKYQDANKCNSTRVTVRNSLDLRTVTAYGTINSAKIKTK